MPSPSPENIVVLVASSCVPRRPASSLGYVAPPRNSAGLLSLLQNWSLSVAAENTPPRIAPDAQSTGELTRDGHAFFGLRSTGRFSQHALLVRRPALPGPTLTRRFKSLL